MSLNSAILCKSLRRDHRQFNEACVPGRVVDALRRLVKILRLSPKDIGHEGLGIAVVEREPTGLNLHHDPVARQACLRYPAADLENRCRRLGSWPAKAERAKTRLQPASRAAAMSSFWT